MFEYIDHTGPLRRDAVPTLFDDTATTMKVTFIIFNSTSYVKRYKKDRKLNWTLHAFLKNFL